MFKEEKSFLEKLMGIELPNQCWIDGRSIYLNHDSDKSIVEFNIVNGLLNIKKNILKSIDGNRITVEFKRNGQKTTAVWINHTWEEEIAQEEEHLKELYNTSYEKTKEYILSMGEREYMVSISGGKDSDIIYYITSRVFNELKIDNYMLNYFNTTNETGTSYKHVKNDYDKERLYIHNPDKGWYTWLKEDKKWYLPSVMSRNCCEKYKENQLNLLLDKDKRYIIFLGARKYESVKRSDYDWDLNEKMVEIGRDLNVPMEWRRFLPIVEWKDADVWLFILKENIPFNPMYRLGYNRTGCLICPYANDYIDLLTKEYYPLLWKRWEYAIEQNYINYGVENRLKWSLDEWKLGKWKIAVSKEYELIRLTPTPERIEELSRIKGISKTLAEKYFKRTCSCCGKKLNPDEVSMSLKIYGRFEDLPSDMENKRVLHCKKCMCKMQGWKQKDYKSRVMEFRNQGCELF